MSRKSKVGGARPGAGRKTRSGEPRVAKTVMLTPGEIADTEAAAKAAGSPWSVWAGETLVAAARR